MRINNLETFKGLINKFDLDDVNQLKVSSMYNFFEEATGFTSSLLNKKIDSNFDEKLEIDDLVFSYQEFQTIYILTDLIQQKDDIQIIHKLHLTTLINDSKDQLIVVKNVKVNNINLDSISKNKPVIEKDIFSAFKGLVRKNDCDQMSHMNVQYYFGKHNDAIKILFNKISGKTSGDLIYQIVNERCIFSKEVSLGCALEFIFTIKNIDDDKIILLTKDDPYSLDDVLVDADDLHILLDRPLKLNLRALDVLHDFYVPQFRAKMDMVPGTITYYWFTPIKIMQNI
jgi:hypothetical protein